MWAKVCDSLAFHPKVLAAGNAAVGGWVRLLAWSCGHGTGGVIPISIAQIAVSETDLKSLLDTNLLEIDPAGYRIHDFYDYQPSASRLDAEKERKRRNLQAFRARQRSNGDTVEPAGETAPETDFKPVSEPVANRGEIVSRTRTRTEEENPPVLRTDPHAGGPRKRAAKKPKADLTDAELNDRERLIAEAIRTDETLAPIVEAPGRLARDLLAVAPGVDVPREVKGAGAWIRANPERAKIAGHRYLLNWLKRAQDSRGGRTAYTTPGYRAQPVVADGTGWKARETTEVEVSDDDIPY